MITETFDNNTEEIIKVQRNENAKAVDACILTFSNEILQYVLEAYNCTKIGDLFSSNGANPVFAFRYKDKEFAVYMSYVGAPGCVADIEDTLSVIKTDKYVVFGGSGCLNKEIARGKVMVPTAAYRDEGTSYQGKTWTTDAVHRETRANFEKRKNEGCISVEMECAAVQAMCDYRGLQAYFFFTCGDLLDAPKWDERKEKNQKKHTQHDPGHFDIALELACYIG